MPVYELSSRSIERLNTSVRTFDLGKISDEFPDLLITYEKQNAPRHAFNTAYFKARRLMSMGNEYVPFTVQID